MKMTGQILKENRERKGVSLSEVSVATKISSKLLIAIEEGHVDALPPKTILRGFVRSYAGYLGLEVEALMSTFQDEMGSTRPTVATHLEAGSTAVPTAATAVKNPATAADERINPKTSTSMKIGAALGIFVLITLIIFFKNKMESYEQEASDRSVPPGLQAIPSFEPESTDPEEIQSVLTPSDHSIPDLNALIASPTPSIEAEVKTPTPAPTPTPTPNPEPGPNVVAATPAPIKAQQIIIEALDAVDIETQIDDEPQRKIRLRADQVRSLEVRRKVVLRLSDGGAVNLIVNGVDRGVPGDLGKPLRIELP